MSLSITGRSGVIALVIAGLIAAFVAGYALYLAAPKQVVTVQDARPDAHRKVLYWYEPMVPGQRFDKPGKSPFMDMPLTPRYADQTPDDGGITLSTRQQQNLGVAVATVQKKHAVAGPGRLWYRQYRRSRPSRSSGAGRRAGG